MIDPKNITNINRTQSELEAFALFAVAVAGKKALQTANKITAMLEHKPETQTPFQFLKGEFLPLNTGMYAGLGYITRKYKLGQYNRIVPAFEGLMEVDLRTCSFEDLVAIKGIGPKTANFFLLHSRHGYEGVVLDTHILRWMRDVHGVKTPKQTPQGKSYAKFAVIAKQLIKKSYPLLTLADADLVIWKMMSGNN